MPLTKPPGIARDAFKSAKWDELTQGRNFTTSDMPVLALLVQWYAVVQRCIDDMSDAGGQVAYQNDMGDLKTLPQIGIMKQASAEIRQLNKQLGINDEAGRGPPLAARRAPHLRDGRIRGGTRSPPDFD